MRKSALSREEMLDRLLEVFRQKGFEGASIADLMRATNLQKGSLYHHFPGGKDEMAAAVLAHVGQLFEAMVFTPLRHAPTAAAGIAMMSRALEGYFAAGSKVCLPALMGLGASRDPFGRLIEGFFEQWITALADCLIGDGMPADAAALAAERAVSDIQGGIVLARALGRADPFLRALGRLGGLSAGGVPLGAQ